MPGFEGVIVIFYHNSGFRRSTTVTSSAAAALSTTSRNKPTRSELICEIIPIAGGPMRNPRYPIPLTVATPIPSAIDLNRPPAANTSGIIEEKPAPAAAIPTSTTHGDETKTASAIPAAASDPPSRTVSAPPSLFVILSPAIRNPAIDAEKTA